ncbi:MAG: hypothetical protein VX583_08220 [Bdellovibrionota bacterium]|nr:hypothetical protein [Pseudobdellovibrionaceae bacterium]|tara:strand:+ start:25116 stop:25988 length:873 start_codon:yes stop_codon:yes gene_type:complete
MFKNLDEDELRALLQKKEEEIIFLKDELLKAAHQMERFAERTEEQGRISASLLKLLSPTEFPQIPGYQISSKFSASFKGSEYMELVNYKEKTHFGILMSHCEGAGLSALFLACLLKMSPEMDSARRLGSYEFVQKISKELQESLDEKAKLSIFYAMMNRTSSELNVTSFGNYLLLKRDKEENLSLVSEFNPEISSQTILEENRQPIGLAMEEHLVVLSPGFLKAFTFSSQNSAADFFKDKLKKLDWSDLNQVRNEFFVLQSEALNGKKSDYDACVLVMQNQDRSLKLASV